MIFFKFIAESKKYRYISYIANYAKGYIAFINIE